MRFTVAPDSLPADTRHWANAKLLLDQRGRRSLNIKPALVQCTTFVVIPLTGVCACRGGGGQNPPPALNIIPYVLQIITAPVG